MADLFHVPYVRAVWRWLHERLGDSGRLFIFGAGEHTRWLLSVTHDMPAGAIASILDDGAPMDDVHGSRVRRPDDVEVRTNDLILVSSDRWENELAARARAVFGTGVEVIRLYESLPIGPYDKNDDRTEALARLAQVHTAQMNSDGRKESRQIVLIADQPRGREWKLATALRSLGWEIVLLYHRVPLIDVSRHFARAIHYRTPWEALRLACDFTPTAYHVMANSDYRLAEMFLRNRPGPVIVDTYDLIAGMYTDELLAARPALAAEGERERFCLEHADGLCCRCRESDHAADVLEYGMAPRVLFSDGCNNQHHSTGEPSTDDIHVVYVGHLTSEAGAGKPFSDAGRLLWLARAMAEQSVHFHIYPGFEVSADEFARAFVAYLELERESACFHLHRPVAADTLPHELARYDYGMFVYREFVRPSETGVALTPAKLRLCTCNKFYDYLDAGLPVVHNASPESDLAAIAEDHGAGVDLSGVPLEQWGTTLRKQDRSALRTAAARARAYHDVRRHAPRLVRFYESVRRGRASASTDRGQWFEEQEHA